MQNATWKTTKFIFATKPVFSMYFNLTISSIKLQVNNAWATSSTMPKNLSASKYTATQNSCCPSLINWLSWGLTALSAQIGYIENYVAVKKSEINEKVGNT